MTVVAMSEGQLQSAVLEAARRLGWRCAHFRAAPTRSGGWATPVQADAAGFPDLVMLRGDRCLAIELKAAGKKPRAEQVVWLEAFAAVAGVRADVWDVDDWRNGHVERELR